MLGHGEWTALRELMSRVCSRSVYLRTLPHVVLLALQILLPCAVLGNEPGPTQCIDCGKTAANCTVNTANQTVSCEVDASSCGSKDCEEGRFCQLVFSFHDNKWFFDSECFPAPEEEECNLSLHEVPGDEDIFPPDLLVCQCNDVEKCGGPHVYTHQYTPSPSPPSPSPSSSPTLSE